MSSSEDEMPEGISFMQSREEEILKQKLVQQDLQREKDKKKFIHQSREKRNIAQKEKKLLSVELLKKADAAIKLDEARKKKLQENSDTQEIDNEQSKNVEEDSFVKITKTKEFTKPLSTEAVSFKTNHLYNGRIRRMDNKQQQNLKHKLMAKSSKLILSC
ncbi:uncharacterized protein LOC100179438 isoform X1 [Ciona intestinalis]